MAELSSKASLGHPLASSPSQEDLVAVNRRIKEEHVATLEKLAVLQHQVSQYNKRKLDMSAKELQVKYEEVTDKDLLMRLGRQEHELASLLEQNRFLRAENTRLLELHQQRINRSLSPARTVIDSSLGPRLVQAIQDRSTQLVKIFSAIEKAEYPISHRLTALLDHSTTTDAVDTKVTAFVQELISAVDFYTSRPAKVESPQADMSQILEAKLLSKVAEIKRLEEQLDAHERALSQLLSLDRDSITRLGHADRLEKLLELLRESFSKTTKDAPYQAPSVVNANWKSNEQQRHYVAHEHDDQSDLLMQWLEESKDGSESFSKLTELIESHVNVAANIKQERDELRSSVNELTETLDLQQEAWKEKLVDANSKFITTEKHANVLAQIMQAYEKEFSVILATSPMHQLAMDKDNSESKANETSQRFPQGVKHPLPFQSHFRFVIDSLASANHALTHSRKQLAEIRAELKKLVIHRDALQLDLKTANNRLLRLEGDCDAAKQKFEVVQHAVEQVHLQYDEELKKNSELEDRLYRVCNAFHDLVLT